MSLKIEKGEPVLVQGITGRYGSYHTKLMLGYGTNIVAGVTPGKGGQSVHGVPVFNNVSEAVESSGARISVIFVPAQNFFPAAKEAIEGAIKLIVAITEHVPVRDSLTLKKIAAERRVRIVGPNTPGIIVPNIIKLGIMPAEPFTRGRTTVFSRSGTLMYEVCYYMSKNGIGQSMALGIGGDPVNCTSLSECMEWARKDPYTDRVVVIGEIGGDAEELIARYMRSVRYEKPVVVYIAGRHAPKEKKMGHAGAIIYGSYGTAESKIRAFQEAGASVAKEPREIPALLGGKG